MRKQNGLLQKNIRKNVENDGDIWNIISIYEIIFRNNWNSLTKRIHKYIMETAMRKWQAFGQGSHSHKGEGEVGKGT